MAQVLTLDFHLDIAATKQETVIVSATTASVVTDSPAVESTIVREQIETLPLNARDFNQLVLLSAGAVESAYGGDFGGVALNGNRAYGNGYMLDGTPNNNPFQNTAAVGVSVDDIREFKVTSGAAPAEYGQAESQITLVTRSGGNSYHGSAFEYHRGTTWQATNPFNPGVTQPFERNQFGGSLGGPIRHNRTFYFVNYEGNRQNLSAPVVATMPPNAMWQGDFSQLLARNIQLRDPLTGTAKTPIPGDIIPASRISPTSLKLHPYWGSPTLPGVANNFIRNSTSTNNGDQFTTRFDHILPKAENLSFRFTQANSSAFTPSITANTSGYRNDTFTDNASLGWTAPINATTVGEVHLGFSDFHSQLVYLSGGLPTATDVGMIGFVSNNPSLQPMPQYHLRRQRCIHAPQLRTRRRFLHREPGRQDHQSDRALTMVRGNHTIKIGAELRNETLPSILQADSGGSISFTGNNAVTSTGYSFADFLIGFPTTALQAPPVGSVKLKLHQIAGYIEDDWRVLRRLTLDVGLRYELSSNPDDTLNRYSMFDPADRRNRGGVE